MPAPRVVLITGCSSPQGIGFATARRLAQAGHEVHATVRDHAHDGRLCDGLEDRLRIHDLDLRDDAQIRAVVADVADLEVLINNAGYGLIGGIEQTELSRVRENFETNLFATVALIQEVLPSYAHVRAATSSTSRRSSPPACACRPSGTTQRRRRRWRRSAKRSRSRPRRGTCA